jgi:hypothetical protein
MSRPTGVQLMLNSAIYQGFVRPSVRPLLPSVAVYPRISWMESWMTATFGRAIGCGETLPQESVHDAARNILDVDDGFAARVVLKCRGVE